MPIFPIDGFTARCDGGGVDGCERDSRLVRPTPELLRRALKDDGWTVLNNGQVFCPGYKYQAQGKFLTGG